MTADIVQRVIRIIAKTERIPVESITIDSTLQELGVDSLDAFSILFEIENEFQITIPDEAGRKITDVRSICEGVATLLGERAPTPAEAA